MLNKQILKDINTKVRSQTKANQWRNNTEVIEWFKTLHDKSILSFAIFDIVDFCTSITENVLSHTLEYASKFTYITEQERNVFMHANKSLLFGDNKLWYKRNNSNMLDLSVSCFDSAEICELFGLYILDKLGSEFNNENMLPKICRQHRKTQR